MCGISPEGPEVIEVMLLFWTRARWIRRPARHVQTLCRRDKTVVFNDPTPGGFVDLVTAAFRRTTQFKLAWFFYANSLSFLEFWYLAFWTLLGSRTSFVLFALHNLDMNTDLDTFFFFFFFFFYLRLFRHMTSSKCVNSWHSSKLQSLAKAKKSNYTQTAISRVISFWCNRRRSKARSLP